MTISHDPKTDPQPGPSSAVEDAYNNLADVLSARQKMSEEDDRLRTALKQNEDALVESDNVVRELRRSLTRAILTAHPRPLPSINEWFHSPSPLWRVRIGDRIFVAIPDLENGAPSSFDEVPEKIVIAVVDVNEPPGFQVSNGGES